MIGDDHEIRDGWGSFARQPDAGGMLPGRKIHEKYHAFFADARDVARHFQMVHNPPPALGLSQPLRASRSLCRLLTPRAEVDHNAMPFVFRAAQRWWLSTTR
jgi:hypothetical protein